MSLNYPDIGVHAVSRDSSVFPYRPCLLLLHSVLSMDADEDQEDVIQYRFALANEEHCKSGRKIYEHLTIGRVPFAQY